MYYIAIIITCDGKIFMHYCNLLSLYSNPSISLLQPLPPLYSNPSSLYSNPFHLSTSLLRSVSQYSRGARLRAQCRTSVVISMRL